MNESSNHEHPGLKRRCIFGWEAPLLPAAHRSRQNSQIRGRENIYGGKLRIGRRLAGRTDGRNPPTEASSAAWCLRSSWAFVCFPACASSCQAAPWLGLGEGGLGPDHILGRPKGQIVL